MAIKCIEEIVKYEIIVVINNSKLNIFSFKVSLNAIKEFSIIIIYNKNIKNTFIIQFLLRDSGCNISIPRHTSYWKMKNPKNSNKSNQNKAEARIELKNEIIQDILICKTNKSSSQ